MVTATHTQKSNDSDSVCARKFLLLTGFNRCTAAAYQGVLPVERFWTLTLANFKPSSIQLWFGSFQFLGTLFNAVLVRK